MPLDSIRDQLQSALGDAYILGRELGGGGMSRVFVAEETALGRQVVVKVLSADLLEGLSADRFTREIRLAATLQEPHIVPLLAAGVTPGGLPYYTMPFVRGESLRARLGRGPLARGEAAHILRDIACALAYAHTQGVVHRDIKPENILLHEGTAVVTDFGIAKAMRASKAPQPTGGTLTSIGTSIGTPAYMAPEQAAGDHVDHRADLYAWGVVAYELLAGRHPFAERKTAQQLVAAHIAEHPSFIWLHEQQLDVSGWKTSKIGPAVRWVGWLSRNKSSDWEVSRKADTSLADGTRLCVFQKPTPTAPPTMIEIGKVSPEGIIVRKFAGNGV